jgi:ribosomal protein S18 acetylase RimI-like enzyme
MPPTKPPRPVPRIEAANALAPPAFQTRFLPCPPAAATAAAAAAVALFQPPAPDAAAYRIVLVHAAELARADLGACFDLVAATSAAAYAASSRGWRPAAKRREMRLPDLRYLLVRPAQGGGLPEAFLSFMLTYEDGCEVVYCYEVHVGERLRGMGLGTRLVGLMEEVGRRVGVEKAMLTVFVTNGGAAAFYARLGYGLDAYSPPARRLRNGVAKEPDIHILSKALGWAV